MALDMLICRLASNGYSPKMVRQLCKHGLARVEVRLGTKDRLSIIHQDTVHRQLIVKV
jgi:hypothetical protein